jgi:hypothetical protein
MTLDHMEHHILRKQFNEPRIHAALVCAALGCPPLRNVPFEGQVLNRQLDEQMKRFLSDPQKFRVERKAGVVWLSPIFKWFGDDFLRKHGTDSQFTRQSAAIGAVLHAVIPHVHSEHAEYLRSETYSVKFLDYDWTLNEQRQP